MILRTSLEDISICERHERRFYDCLLTSIYGEVTINSSEQLDILET
ncbi:MAG: hypothetical protein H7196_04270 [candidate division SR1 bacterium]|nr:hypothetical protein [candidate division SR1 bacterium]